MKKPSTATIGFEDLRQDYGAFVLAMNPTYAYTHFQQTILAPIYERITRGELKRVMVTMPFRHSKTDLGTLNFVPFYLGHNPSKTVMVLSYGKKLARTFGRAIRDKMRTPLYDALFPASVISKSSHASDEFQTVSGGKLFASSFDGMINGVGVDCLIVDDPHKSRAEATSEIIIDRIRETYNNVVRTRLEPGASILINTTRWTPADLVGWRVTEDTAIDYFTKKTYIDMPIAKRVIV